jgi:hypothetical protein
METVLAAFIIVFIVLFAAFTLSHAFLSSQDTLRVAWEVWKHGWMSRPERRLSR